VNTNTRRSAAEPSKGVCDVRTASVSEQLKIKTRIGLLAIAMLAGCAGVSQLQFTRLDGTSCELTHANAVFYSGAEWVDCIGKDGKVETLKTAHTDLGMVAGPGEALVGLGAMAVWAPILATH
jgi:hypothetical protein